MLDVVRKEFKDHVGEMEAIRGGARDKHDDGGCGEKWVAFGDSDEGGFHPNLFSQSQKQNSLNPFV